MFGTKNQTTLQYYYYLKYNFLLRKVWKSLGSADVAKRQQAAPPAVVARRPLPLTFHLLHFLLTCSCSCFGCKNMWIYTTSTNTSKYFITPKHMIKIMEIHMSVKKWRQYSNPSDITTNNNVNDANWTMFYVVSPRPNILYTCFLYVVMLVYILVAFWQISHERLFN